MRRHLDIVHPLDPHFLDVASIEAEELLGLDTALVERHAQVFQERTQDVLAPKRLAGGRGDTFNLILDETLVGRTIILEAI